MGGRKEIKEDMVKEWGWIEGGIRYESQGSEMGKGRRSEGCSISYPNDTFLANYND